MKVKEPVERECCLNQDLKLYYGMMEANFVRYHPRFCIFCGQIWVEDSRMDAAGGTEWYDRRVLLNDNADWEK